MKYRAVIFDLDGTLVDTLEDIAESVNQVLTRLSLPTHPVESYRHKVGSGNRVLVARALPEDRQELVEPVLQSQLSYYEKHFYDHSRAYPGVEELLGKLGEMGLKLAVLSNKPDNFVLSLTERCFGNDYFQIRRGQRAGTPLKPDPTSALGVADEMGVSPGETIFVGDSGVDMQTARNAGMLAVGVAWGFRDWEELEAGGCEVFIERPEDLLAVVEG